MQRWLEQADDRLDERGGLLLRQVGGKRSRRERCANRAEEATSELLPARAEPACGGAEALVLGEAGGELGGSLLGALLLDVAVALAEQPASLDLAQGGDEQQELRHGLEIELLDLGESLDVLDHDLGDGHLDEVDLLAQHEREQQVEGACVRVEVELELEDGRAAHPAIVAAAADARSKTVSRSTSRGCPHQTSCASPPSTRTSAKKSGAGRTR